MPHRLRASLWRFRWLVVSVCVACAVWLVVGELRPAPMPTVPVVVAAHSLPAGSTVTAADVRVDHAAAAPPGSVSLEDAVGATLTIGVTEGLPLVTTMLLGPGLLEAAPPGWAVVPVVLADPVLADLLRVGDRVDLYLAAADTGGRLDEAHLVTSGALVLAKHQTDGAQSWLGGSSSQVEATIVAIRPADAAALAGAAGFGPFRAVLSGR